MGMIAIASIWIWAAAIKELLKPSDRQGHRKIIILTAVGTLSAAVLTVSLL
ncbi:hypothetical protein QRD89_11245 [Halobacillus sp. ACCC02827]|uniref:hypothetical protein n=1 Tax=Bacillaceae TaxID=186817 RepID=UPI0002A4F983|nr:MULTISPECIES: hypothetical protein [Bacillaceae]ELK44894.1 hypothetical protein D479_17034 [Halobacillus sp. BAB-2008]WJE14301.1 hypothetical protein QRD89_11245 [Halobacillus sp. ACCC02827]